RDQATSLTQAQINSYTPYTFYACAGYCPPDRTLVWGCGEVCNANSFQPVASGGSAKDFQYWFVGYDPTLETIIVAHDGASDPNNRYLGPP
ncbi:hypothetical protein HYDPIDRAFT_88515, partial [Hydnomerulius pinastri MD-312]